MFVPSVPNPFDDDAHRTQLAEQNLDTSRRWRSVFFGGWLVLAAFGVFAVMGYPGAGLVLVPIGTGMILGGAVQLVLDRL